MNILVTGANGFIGWNLCKRLLKDNHNLIAVDYRESYRPRIKDSIMLNDKKSEIDLPILNIDLSDSCEFLKQSISRFHDVDMIVHLAASSGVPGSIKDPRGYYKNNIFSFQNIIEIARIAKCSLIYASSSSVYGTQQNVWEDNKSLKGRVLSPYAQTKLFNEQMAFLNRDVPSVGLRFFTVYGPWGRPEMSIMKFIDQAIKGDPIIIYGKPQEIQRSFTYIDDVVEAICTLIRNKENLLKPKTYNVCRDNESVFLEQVIIEIEKYLPKVDLRFEPQDDRKWDIKKSIGTSCLPGWTPQISFAEGMKRTIDWMLENMYGVAK